jgi:CDP-glucose 4,6-dehydratase
MGTVHVLEAARACPSVKAAVVVTSDKCYENHEWHWPYREIDRLGGHDPYSSSKACAELVTNAYVRSFFEAEGPLVATARAGNVIGGGDWADDRLVPDIVRALSTGKTPCLRRPHSVRPWQHVLEPLYGYLQLAQQLAQGARAMAESWNFGPDASAIRSVGWLADTMLDHWGGSAAIHIESGQHSHEAGLLTLDSSKARAKLGWHPKLAAQEAVAWTVDWYKSVLDSKHKTARVMCDAQIERYLSLQGHA